MIRASLGCPILPQLHSQYILCKASNIASLACLFNTSKKGFSRFLTAKLKKRFVIQITQSRYTLVTPQNSCKFADFVNTFHKKMSQILHTANKIKLQRFVIRFRAVKCNLEEWTKLCQFIYMPSCATNRLKDELSKKHSIYICTSIYMYIFKSIQLSILRILRSFRFYIHLFYFCCCLKCCSWIMLAHHGLWMAEQRTYIYIYGVATRWLSIMPEYPPVFCVAQDGFAFKWAASHIANRMRAERSIFRSVYKGFG